LQPHLIEEWLIKEQLQACHLRMEQSGFRPDQQQAYQGAKGGWQQFFSALEQVLTPVGARISINCSATVVMGSHSSKSRADVAEIRGKWAARESDRGAFACALVSASDAKV
jgi:hypothetical protein